MTRTAFIRKKIAAIRRLPGADRRLLVRAALWLLAVDVGLRTLGFSRLRRLLARGLPSGPAADERSPAVRSAEAERVARLVAAAARHHLYPVKCLTRSLVLWRLLALRGLPSELRIGVRKEERTLLAHAWVEHGGARLEAGVPAPGRFLPLA